MNMTFGYWVGSFSPLLPVFPLFFELELRVKIEFLVGELNSVMSVTDSKLSVLLLTNFLFDSLGSCFKDFI